MENNNFTQLCVWQGVLLDDLDGSEIKELEDFFIENFDTRIKYETQIKTLPDLDRNGNIIAETGGRNDVFFYVHADDIPKFAVPRLSIGIRWWEDVIVYNDDTHLYPQEFRDKYPATW